jgi:hypothetical protein
MSRTGGKKRKIQNGKVKYPWSNAVLAKKQNVTEPMVSMLKIIELLLVVDHT